MASRFLPRSTPRLLTVLTPLVTSLLTSGVTVPVALWAIRPPVEQWRLVAAIAVSLAAIALGALVGRAIARRLAAYTERRRATPRGWMGAERRTQLGG